MDDRLHVLDGYIEFDQLGNFSKLCSRGHVDFAGWGCMTATNTQEWPDVLQTQLDSTGRIVRRQRFRSEKDGFVTCSYDDSSTPPASKCSDDVWIQEYTYDQSGRPLAYRRRHTHSPDETVVDVAVHYIYTDDQHGNWTELRIVYDKSSSVISHEDLILRRKIDYY